MPRSVGSFFKTPKGLLIVVLLIFLVFASPTQDIRAVLTGMASAAGGAALVDALILRWRKKAWKIPDGAMITAAIVVMVLRAQEPWYVTTAVSILGVISKYAFRAGRANIFNPAALAMVAGFYLFHSGESWWGALTDTEPILKLPLFAGGLYIANRVNKLPLVLTFLGVYFGLFTLNAFFGDALSVAEIFRTPDAEAAFYFAFIILTDPPTSPNRYRDQIVFSLIAAAVSYAFFELAGVVYFLLAGALAANVWEAWRRSRRRAGIHKIRIESNQADRAPSQTLFLRSFLLRRRFSR
jgi:Na+-translocating ferredoxin:NAD+ oxidoreductase RnfD subunit